jgi:hypothetical protein
MKQIFILESVNDVLRITNIPRHTNKIRITHISYESPIDKKLALILLNNLIEGYYKAIPYTQAMPVAQSNRMSMGLTHPDTGWIDIPPNQVGNIRVSVQYEDGQDLTGITPANPMILELEFE